MLNKNAPLCTVSSTTVATTSDDLISGFQLSISIQYRYDILKISRYQCYFKNDKYVNLIQAQEQDVNAQQGSSLYVNTKMCQ